MYVINKGDDGHGWTKSPKSEQPIHRKFKKLYCVYCGVKAYTVSKTKVSLTGEYYNGEIQQCPGRVSGFVNSMKRMLKNKKKKRKDKKKNKMVRAIRPIMVRTK